MRYKVIREKTHTGWSAYIPNLPGVIATGKTTAVVIKRLREAVKLHKNPKKQSISNCKGSNNA